MERPITSNRIPIRFATPRWTATAPALPGEESASTKEKVLGDEAPRRRAAPLALAGSKGDACARDQ